MLREALKATRIPPQKAASLLGVNPDIFQAWVAEQRPIPHSYEALLSTIVGMDLSDCSRFKQHPNDDAEMTPAIWYRLREPKLVDQDREYVFLIRQLGYFIHELEEVTETKLVGWKALFDTIRGNVDKQAPPRAQGREAGRMFRESRGLTQTASGIGEIIRGNLRSMGIVVIETPVAESLLEGCCFFVGDSSSERPCVFANSHHSTWFRRNITLLHEVAHAIFDAESAGAMLDFRDSEDDQAIAEERADAFAQEVMVPKKILVHIAQANGIKWSALDKQGLATLVAKVQVGQRTVLRAALAAHLITSEQCEECSNFGSVMDEVRPLSDRALTTEEYIKKNAGQDLGWLGKRNTTIPSTPLRLPSLYVTKVIEAVESCQISKSKAAEMLMIDEEMFMSRFGAVVEEPEDL